MELKRFQKRVLATTEAFLKRLAVEQAASAKHPSLDAWEEVTKSRAYRERRDGLDRDLPDVWLKVPTGGGKTLLAAHVLGQVFETILAERNGAGLALWIVPSDAIYAQTLSVLRDRKHAVRLALESRAGRRVEVWEKDQILRLRPSQLVEDLNVLVLKLPSANRQLKDTLRMFKDAGGNIVQHFPPEDDAEAHRALRARCPNLEMIDEALARTSLANLIRIAEPPVILDEGHKAFSDLARRTLEGFNARILVELSATPPDGANVLVRVTGSELLAEDMIKLPINVLNSSEEDWKAVLGRAHDRRRQIAKAAERHAKAKGGCRIRPIVLVQVERTGKDQRGAGFIHAEDVKDYLMRGLGIPEVEIRIKSSETDDIEGVDLLDEGCPVTWILTKAALQEGWDCPFAYILVSLTNLKSARAMTQLVGRVLRQPDVTKTGDPALDESFVFCLKESAGEVVRQVRDALEREGYEGDSRSVVDRTDTGSHEAVTVSRVRPKFRRFYREFSGKVYLPRFCVRDGKGYEGLDYFRHLIAEVTPDTFAYSAIEWSLAEAVEKARALYYRVTLGQTSDRPVREEDVEALDDDRRVASWLAANLPFEHFSWRERDRIVSGVLARVLEIEPDLVGRLALLRYPLRDRIVEFVREQTDVQTEKVFRRMLKEGSLTFFLECRECRFELPPQVELRSLHRRLVHDDNQPLQRSLFDPVPEDEFNCDERNVALFLDRQPEVLWWYRNHVGRKHFAIQGYRRDKIYPDFVVQRAKGDDPAPTVLVAETKGPHLTGNPDTLYKRQVAQVFDRLGKRVTWQDLGAGFADSTFRFQVIDLDENKAWVDEFRRLLVNGSA